MGEGGGTTVRDISGFGNHGTMISMDPATDWVIGQFGKALDFDGSGDRITIPYTASLDVQDHVTVAAWVTISDLSARRNIYSERWDDSVNGLFQLETGTESGQTESVGVTTNGVFNAATAIGSVAINTLHHIVYTRGGTTQHIYIDGVDQSLLVDSPQTLSTVTTPRVIGASDVGFTPAQFFSGKQDEVRLYNRAINAAEVWSLYTQPYLEFEPEEIFIAKAPAAGGANPHFPLGHPLHGPFAGPVGL